MSELQKEPLEKIREMPAVKIAYKSTSGNENISKKLFGYGPWSETKAGRRYQHKPVPGVLQGTFARKCGKACLIVSEEMAAPVTETIVKLGGEIKSATPVVITKKEVEEIFEDNYKHYLRILKGLLKSASISNNKEALTSNLKKATTFTRKFESFITEISEYAEEKPKPKALDNLFAGLKSVMDQDFEAAKIQTEFFAKSVEREYNTLTKSLSK